MIGASQTAKGWISLLGIIGIITSILIYLAAVCEPPIMPSPEDTDFSGSHSKNHRLDDPLEDYLVAKSKTGGTGNYRRNAERVIRDWIDVTDQHRDVQMFDGLDSVALEPYALYLMRRVNGGGIATSTARKYILYTFA